MNIFKIFRNKLIRRVLKAFETNSAAQETSVHSGKSDYESNGISEVCLQAAAESAVLLQNDGVLPLKSSDRIAVFGRVQFDWFATGYGSGGDVNVPYKVNLIDGLKNAKFADGNGVMLDESVISLYEKWRKKPWNVADEGFWGHWPRYFEEMPLSDDAVKSAAKANDVALIAIGRSSGEDRENTLEEGSYYLTKQELELLRKVTSCFKKSVVVINSGAIIDMSWLDEFEGKIGAVLLAWQGGMESGNAVAAVLTGKINPSGRLTGAIAKSYQDYPSAKNFGGTDFNNYVEDIFVGYRFFETFAKDAVKYPFGFGLSYTEFDLKVISCEKSGDKIDIAVEVKNVGNRAGKEVVQVYASAPQGVLGKPSRVLAAFKKTAEIAPGGSEVLTLSFDMYALASYDDSGKTGNKSCYVLEAGDYQIFVGKDVRAAEYAYTVNVEKLVVLTKLSEAMAPLVGDKFKRMTAKGGGEKLVLEYENVPTRTVDLKRRILDNLPQSTPQLTNSQYKLSDVAEGKISLEQFVATLSLVELEAITRGEGLMRSSLGAPGNAGALGGVTESLREKGIPPVMTADGPSGIRLFSVCSLIPCGFALASTWNTDLVEAVYDKLGKEMSRRGVDVLLAPGMNIHRNPLCGRNFEYFSEDPLLTGKIASAAVKGVQKDSRSACPKHFACNNQEVNRLRNDSRVSERALREIYLKGFEIVVKEASPLNIMTSYNKVNGVWSHYNYDLATTILRGEWGYEGNLVTDWWMQYAPSPEFPQLSGNGYRVRAQVDVLMPGTRSGANRKLVTDETLLETYGQPDGITLGEMQRSAENVLTLVLKSSAYRRFIEGK